MLESIQSSSYNLLTNSKFWMILLLILLFLIVAVYVYNKYVNNVINPTYIDNNEFPTDMNKDNDTSDTGPEVEIIIFTVDWCPHSKNAMPIWEELKEKYYKYASKNVTNSTRE